MAGELSIEEFVAELGFQFNPEGSKKFKDSMKSVGKFAAKVTTGVIALGGALFALTAKTAEYGDETAKLSRQIGFNAQALQELEFAADRSGLGADNLRSGLTNLNNSLGQLKLGTGGLLSELKLVNPALAQQLFAAKDSAEAFDLLTNAISNTEDPARRAALAQAAFGNEKFVRLMEGGAKGVNQLRKEARELGIVLGEKALKDSEDFKDSMTDIKALLKGLGQIVTSSLIPVFKEVVGEFKTWIDENKEFIKQNAPKVMKQIADNAVQVVRVIVDVSKVIGSLIKNLGGLIQTVKIVGSVFVGIFAGKIALAIATMLGFVGAIPIAIAAAVAAVVAALTWVITNWDKVTDAFKSGVDFISNLLDEMSNNLTGKPKLIFDAWIGTFKALLTFLMDGFLGFVSFITDLFEGDVSEIPDKIVDAWIGAWKKVFDFVADGAGKIAKFFSDLFGDDEQVKVIGKIADATTAARGSATSSLPSVSSVNTSTINNGGAVNKMAGDVNQTNQININTNNPEAAGAAVERSLENWAKNTTLQQSTGVS
jgi:hypothetical protein